MTTYDRYKCHQPLIGMDDFDCLQIAFEIMMIDMGDLPGFKADEEIEKNFPKGQTKAEQKKRLTAMLEQHSVWETTRERKTPDEVLERALARLNNKFNIQAGKTAQFLLRPYFHNKELSVEEKIDASLELKGQSYIDRVKEFPYFASDFWDFCKDKQIAGKPLFSSRVVVTEEEIYPEAFFDVITAPKDKKIALFLRTPKTIKEIEQEFSYRNSNPFHRAKERINEKWEKEDSGLTIDLDESDGKYKIVKLC